MENITKKNLYGALEALNCLTRNNYQLEEVFNGWELYHQHDPPTHGAIVCFASSKREMWQKIHDLKTLLIIEQQNKPNDFEKNSKLELQKKGFYVYSLKEGF